MPWCIRQHQLLLAFLSSRNSAMSSFRTSSMRVPRPSFFASGPSCGKQITQQKANHEKHVSTYLEKLRHSCDASVMLPKTSPQKDTCRFFVSKQVEAPVSRADKNTTKRQMHIFRYACLRLVNTQYLVSPTTDATTKLPNCNGMPRFQDKRAFFCIFDCSYFAPLRNNMLLIVPP